VAAIGDDSPLAALDLLPGDVIESIDQRQVTSPRGALAMLEAAAVGRGKSVLMLVNRHGTSHYLALSLRKDSAGSRNG